MIRFITLPFKPYALAAATLCTVLAAVPVNVAAQQPDNGTAQEPAEDAPSQEVDSVFDLVAPDDPPVFDTSAQAVDAFKAALAANDFAAVADLLGLDADKLRIDEGAVENFEKIREAAARKVTVRDRGDHVDLELGHILWPLPFPIEKGDDGKWAFDTDAGIAEIIRRRIGENEIEAMSTARAYVEAQRDYASEDRDGDGVLEYAQKLLSTPGQTDGLYWPADQGDGDSPAAAALDNDQQLEEGVPGEGYYGYRFRILTGQGSNVAGGAYDYIINDNMIAGFALLAWPVSYGESGVTTFIVNHDGIVYERDLGPSTESIVPFIQLFNPDEKWNISEETN